MAWPWKPIMGGLFSTPAAGIYGATSMAQNQGNAMMGNYNLANQSGLDLSNYMTLDGTKPVVNEGQLLADTQNRMPPMLDQTGQMGASNYRGPQGIPFNPDQGNIPYAPDERTGIVQTLKGFTTPTMNFFKKMVEPNTPEENFGRDYFKESMDSSGRIYNNAGDLFGGKIPVSAFGKGMSAAGQKRIDTIENTLRTKYNLGDEEIEDVYAGTYAGPVKSQLIQRLQNFKNQRDQYNRNLAAATGGADIPLGPIDTRRAVTNVINPNVGGATTGGASTYRGPPTRSFDPGLARAMGGQRATKPGGFTDPGRESYGPHRAEGGRIGYQEGELVEDEYMAEATPGGMMEENIEEVQGEPTREQLEAIAFEIFRLPLEQLNEQQLEVVYQAAMEQEPSEEEVQFAAQEGPGEGIASLV